MNLPRPTMQSFWRRRMRQTPAVDDTDPADMGTCYGLEMSLLPASAPAESASARRDAPPWWERSGMRKSCGA